MSPEEGSGTIRGKADETAPAVGPAGSADPAAPLSREARIGIVLFGIYLALYSGFIGLSAFAPGLMGGRSLGGVNLAIVYGIGLILAAVLLSLVYTALCRGRGGDPPAGEEEAR